MIERALNVYEVLRQEYERLHEPLPPDNVDWDRLSRQEEAAKVAELLPGLNAKIHAAERTALCFSGGGIRSATFALGVIQRLAAIDLLPKFDFLSTVSGGGYIGSWLSSYIRRTPTGVAGVSQQLASPPATPLDPEPHPVRHLREFSNYLTPQLGLMSGDTWSAAGTYLRNLLLNWLILIPLLGAVLALPRLVVALLRHESTYLREITWVTGGLFAIAFFYLAFTRPVRNHPRPGKLGTNGGFLWLVVLPLFLASIGGALYAGWTYGQPRDWKTVFAVMIGISALSSIIYMTRYWYANKTENRGDIAHSSSVTAYTFKKLIMETISAGVSAGAATGLLYAANLLLFNDPKKPVTLATAGNWRDFPAILSTANAELFVCFAVPIVLVIFFVQAALFGGLSSWFNEDYDREWWARAGGWVLVAAVAWIAFTGITIYGPVLLYMAPRISAALGTVTGAFAISSGKSGKTPGSGAQKKGETKGGKAMNLGLGATVPIFLFCILALISLVTSRIVFSQSKAHRLTDEEITFYSRGTYEVKTVEKLGAKDPEHDRTFQRIGAGERVFTTTKYPAIEKDKVRALEHLYTVDNARVKSILPVFGALVVAWLISLFIGVNKFSMHAFYRNRLIRAYLGASRWTRHPNPFTGFDPYDNIHMHKLRTETFWVYSFRNLAAFAAALRDPKASTLLQYLYAHLEPRTRKLLAGYEENGENHLLCELLFEDLNSIIDEHDLRASPPRPAPYDPARSLANRRYLDEVLSDYLNPASHGRPFHIINTALNLVAGDNLAWQQRKARSFTVSPLHSGSYDVGYRATREYGGPGGISLGTAVAISGAAASPNMGYHSSPVLAFLLTLFNVRLGWWLGNPGPAGETTWRLRNPRSSLRTLLAEMFGMTNDTNPYVYLSDGGHFENLGLYEMVLRRCRNIVVIDAGCDADHVFDDLGNAVRKIRIDLGIPITIKEMDLYPRGRPGKNQQYCAIGDIHYSKVDAGATDGKLLYVKPVFYGVHEPRDVYNYAQTSQTFPHETTGDQWFSESQFESYRALGYFALSRIVEDQHLAGIADFITKAEANLDAQTVQQEAVPGETI